MRIFLVMLILLCGSAVSAQQKIKAKSKKQGKGQIRTAVGTNYDGPILDPDHTPHIPLVLTCLQPREEVKDAGIEFDQDGNASLSVQTKIKVLAAQQKKLKKIKTGAWEMMPRPGKYRLVLVKAYSDYYVWMKLGEHDLVDESLIFRLGRSGDNITVDEEFDFILKASRKLGGESGTDE